MIRYLLIFLLIPSVCFGANYYVDPGAAAGGNGSHDTPWNSIAQVNAATFATSDRLYFKAGTTLTMTAPMNIRWSGTA